MKLLLIRPESCSVLLVSTYKLDTSCVFRNKMWHSNGKESSEGYSLTTWARVWLDWVHKHSFLWLILTFTAQWQSCILRFTASLPSLPFCFKRNHFQNLPHPFHSPNTTTTVSPVLSCNLHENLPNLVCCLHIIYQDPVQNQQESVELQ